jgi:hypothetical protein
MKHEKKKKIFQNNLLRNKFSTHRIDRLINIVNIPITGILVFLNLK